MVQISTAMKTTDHSSSLTRRTLHPVLARGVSTIMLTSGLLGLTTTAKAVDGCLVLLCFAAPSWRAIPECVPPIQEVLRDLALGRPFPTCDMSGPENTAWHRWSSAPTYCPPQYTHLIDGEPSSYYVCDYIGAVSVQIENELWTRTWWSMGGDSVTEYTPAAKRIMGTWDPRFDNDYAAWEASQTPPPPCEGC